MYSMPVGGMGAGGPVNDACQDNIANALSEAFVLRARRGIAIGRGLAFLRNRGGARHVLSSPVPHAAYIEAQNATDVVKIAGTSAFWRCMS